jgi:D-alanyl-D-alanine dipeptidase
VSLVEIAPDAYDVRIELKYATSDNFTGEPVYRKDAKCYLHTEAAEKLKTAIVLARTQGYRFIIYDAYRPTEAQWKLWEHTPDPDFLADPAKGSPHSRGAAVDLALCKWDWTPLDMGTAFDEFHPRSHHGRLDVNAEAQRNRLLLMGVMTTAGWDFYRNEWWHYQLFNARALYPLVTDAQAPSKVMP